MIARFLAAIGAWLRNSVQDLGFAVRSFFLIIASSGGLWRRPGLVIEQLFYLGSRSVVIIAVSGLFVGMVLGLQGYYTLSTFGATQSLGQLVALSLMRELGPVVTALLFAGRAGTSLTAEIGLMKAGEQLSAMEMMAVNPIQRVLAPRFWAGVIAMPILGGIFTAVGVIGSYLVGVVLIGVDEGSFWSQMQGGVDVWKDIGNGTYVKSMVFGIAVTFIALFQGYQAQPTPEDVSGATTGDFVVDGVVARFHDDGVDV